VAGTILVAVYRAKPPWALDAKYVEKIARAAGGSSDVVQARDENEMLAALADTEVMFGFRLTEENLARAGKLKWVQATSAGVERALFPAFVQSPVVLTSASGIHAVEISEHVFGMMIGLTRRFPFLMRAQMKKQWDRSLPTESYGELFEKTVAVIGLGNIGEAVAVRAKAFGMRVLGVKNSPLGYCGAADEVAAPGAMERVLGEADYVVVLLPETPATGKLVSAEMISAMKPTAFFINCGRGSTVDEKALVGALAAGKIAGAGLDVFDEEPLPPSSRLWKMENVIITPHVAGATPRYWERATDFFCENLRRFAAGDQLVSVVDKELGY